MKLLQYVGYTLAACLFIAVIHTSVKKPNNSSKNKKPNQPNHRNFKKQDWSIN